MTASGSAARRTLAGIGGLAALLIGMTVTIGLALISVGGAIATHALLRLRGRRLTPFTSWLAAVATAAIVLTVLFGVVAAMTDALSPEAMRTAAATDQPPPEPPEWLRRMSPSTVESMQQPDSTAERLLQSDAFMLGTVILGGAMLVLMGGVTAGTLGWISAVLIGYALTGRRPWGPAERVSLDPDDLDDLDWEATRPAAPGLQSR